MRLEQKHIDLIHAEIDGVISSEQQSELRELLSRDTAAQACYEQMKTVCETIDLHEELDPPLDLRASILQELRSTRSSSPQPTVPIPWYRKLWPEVGVAVRYAYTFGAGLLLGVVGYHLTSSTLTGPFVPNGSATGTMGLYRATPGSTEVWPLDAGELGITGEARVRMSKEGFVAEFDVGSPGPFEVTLEFDPANLSFGGFGNDQGATKLLEVSPGRITWSQEGSRRAYVHLVPASGRPSEVTVSLSAPGKPSHSKVFQLVGAN